MQVGLVGKNRDYEPILALSRAVSAPSAKCNILAATDHCQLTTLVAVKRRGSLMAGDDDEVYDKKHPRYAEDSKTTFNCIRSGKS